MPFPYTAPSESLPAPLPTAEDVENARPPELVRADPTPVLYRINKVYAVKFSTNRSALLQEAENLLFLQDHNVRTPKLYATFSHQGADPAGYLKFFRKATRATLPTYYYMVMEFIDGIPLDDEKWEKLPFETRLKLYGKIGEQLQLLRSIPPPHPGFFGRVNSQGYGSFCMIASHRKNAINGPFHSYGAFLKHAWETFEINFIYQVFDIVERPINPEHQIHADNFFHCLEENSASGASTLSHMDLKLENMIFTPSASSTSGRIEDYDLCLIDWEYMGWYPAWADACSAIRRLPRSRSEPMFTGYWSISNKIGIKPFYLAQAKFWMSCAELFGAAI
ncbi:kinase-like domain-containing protein [Massariosphaeria phaeospora]|uniref:Kinase-like domain-containing protein n=1 Tax=Massariosphaeria phaeospora TaxID=100035 RepID=A0A7C8M3L1_9PLEO|nr:kinase-like domain-containing protein [Massariosphaeria phaeospora]